MDFWKEFSKTVAGAASETVKGAEKLTEIAKVKYHLGSLNTKLNECYQTIGKLYCAEQAGEDVSAEMYEGFLVQAEDLKDQIAASEKKLSDLRDYQTCPHCTYRLKKGLNYCPKCGEKFNA